MTLGSNATTVTDAEWDKIKGAYPTNFLKNQTDTFTAGTGWLDSMINRIGLTRCFGVDSFNSPFSEYNRGELAVGDTVQSYKTGVITPEIYNAEKTDDIFKLYRNKPLAQYNTIDVAKTYRLSITQEQIIKAFVSPQTLGDFIGTQMSSLMESDALDQYTEWKKYVSNSELFTQVEVDADTSGGANVDKLYDMIRDLSANFQMPSTKYNKAADKAISSNVDVILTYENYKKLGSKLSNVYNPDYIALNNTNLKYINDFAGSTTQTIQGIVVDNRALNRWIRTPQTWVIQNPVSGVYNYTFKLESIYGVDRFRNAVQIVTKTKTP